MDTEKEIEAREKERQFFDGLHESVKGFEALANSQPTTETKILLCGVFESIAADFKQIFIESWKDQLKAQGVSGNQIKKAVVHIEAQAASLMQAKTLTPQ
jgi:hypothetical protein